MQRRDELFHFFSQDLFVFQIMRQPPFWRVCLRAVLLDARHGRRRFVVFRGAFLRSQALPQARSGGCSAAGPAKATRHLFVASQQFLWSTARRHPPRPRELSRKPWCKKKDARVQAGSVFTKFLAVVPGIYSWCHHSTALGLLTVATLLTCPLQIQFTPV